MVLVCCGTSCKDAKSKKLRKRLTEAVEERGLDDSLTIRETSCLKQCKKGPVILLDKAGKTYDKVKPKDADEVLDKIVKKCKLTE